MIDNYFSGFEEAYPRIIEAIIQNGKKVTPRAGSSIGETLELTPYEFVIPSTKPICRLKARKLSPLFLFLEPMYLFTNQQETDIAAALMTYAPNLEALALNHETRKFDGNYGDRLHLNGRVDNIHYSGGDQMLRAYRLLAKDPDSRRAVVTIHNPVFDIIDGDSKDIPCTLSLQFLIRDGQLDCYCTMRSNDVWYGTPHNVMMFTFLQRAMASWLGVDAGLYHHRANSFHLYTAMEDKAKALLEAAHDYMSECVLETLEDEGKYFYDLPERIEYPLGCKSIVDTQTDVNAAMVREKLYREGRDVPELYPVGGEYMSTLFDLLADFWSKERAKKERDFSDDLEYTNSNEADQFSHKRQEGKS